MPLDMPRGKANNLKRRALYEKYYPLLAVHPQMNRELVSYQANKKLPFYRWYKFKEAFSADLIRFFIESYAPKDKKHPSVLDPFAGIGTTLTVAASAGCKAVGIELMPVGIAAIKARICANKTHTAKFERTLKKLIAKNLEKDHKNGFEVNQLSITKGAFPKHTETAIKNYLEFISKINDENIKYLYWFSCLSVLEEVSYTRKDGQYLRWDSRSSRRLKSEFNKGRILPFKEALINKLKIIIDDIRHNAQSFSPSDVKVIEGSCLDEVPNFASGKFDLIITSPPYCNRYDYTRTYALELAFMDLTDEAVKDLRQAMLSSTVENKSKRQFLKKFYENRGSSYIFETAQSRFDKQEALKEILGNLERARNERILNNGNIPVMIENYFYEMNILIGEFLRILKPGGKVIMVNDNVQYNGEEIPVDLILCDLAGMAGFVIEDIWVLSRGKGNSSQQMGNFGRNELRKCVYVWSKT